MAVIPKPPRSFTILGQRYEVHRYAHVQSDEGKSLAADIDHDMHIVRMAEHGLAADEQAESLLHEALHGIFRKAGFDTELAEHEELVNRVSPILLQFLRANPRVYTYLTGKRFW